MDTHIKETHISRTTSEEIHMTRHVNIGRKLKRIAIRKLSKEDRISLAVSWF